MEIVMHYRNYAAKCVQIAQQIANPKAKASLLDMAQVLFDAGRSHREERAYLEPLCGRSGSCRLNSVTTRAKASITFEAGGVAARFKRCTS